MQELQEAKEELKDLEFQYATVSKERKELSYKMNEQANENKKLEDLQKKLDESKLSEAEKRILKSELSR